MGLPDHFPQDFDRNNGGSGYSGGGGGGNSLPQGCRNIFFILLSLPVLGFLYFNGDRIFNGKSSGDESTDRPPENVDWNERLYGRTNEEARRAHMTEDEALRDAYGDNKQSRPVYKAQRVTEEDLIRDRMQRERENPPQKFVRPSDKFRKPQNEATRRIQQQREEMRKRDEQRGR